MKQKFLVLSAIDPATGAERFVSSAGYRTTWTTDVEDAEVFRLSGVAIACMNAFNIEATIKPVEL